MLKKFRTFASMNTISLFLEQYHVLGLAIGLCTFFVIGIFHPICIKCEYYFGVKCWWWFLLLGIGMGVISYVLNDVFLSTLAGVISFSSFWTIQEIFEQRRRVMKGWFPMNPKRKDDYSESQNG